MRYKPQPVHIRTDQGFDEVMNVSTAAIANGRFVAAHTAPFSKVPADRHKN